ncbi:tRNA-dependent cyclodipeptide synthase [Streptomyces alfalfae]|nr:tRNA-dependent cyclodipeptide synthase [Streptomyces alfalfae]AYA20582.1 tRNA-dependent cyclodipeptide synthase [Streptomyces fradiae]RXX34788.1 tRNA-dependent cyclodipeptide synthase [Streptomyces alfalfae]RZM91565.1 tRNA-dependent cyclodipeptide synthase [Streptomyces alfalfae]
MRRVTMAGEVAARASALPFGASSERLVRRGDHALFGVSTGNSYFSCRRLAEAVAWAVERFAVVDVVHADVALQATLEAFGYEPAAARRSATKQLRGVRRRIDGALKHVGASAERVRSRPLSDFLDQPGYQEVRARARAALRDDLEMRSVRDDTAFRFLAERLRPDGLPAPAQVQAALAYVDAELPFFLDTPRILGVASSVHCYHSVLPLGRLLFGGRPKGPHDAGPHHRQLPGSAARSGGAPAGSATSARAPPAPTRRGRGRVKWTGRRATMRRRARSSPS